MKDLSEIQNDGYAAAKAGKGLGDNPYDKYKYIWEWEAWKEGWLEYFKG